MNMSVRRFVVWLMLVAVTSATPVPLFAEPPIFAAQPPTEPDFGRMFPDLAPFAPADDLLVALALAMQDPNAPENDNPDGVPSGFTYLGQFLDHDTTLDRTPLGSATNIDLVGQLVNSRIPYLNLDSVYGGGPFPNGNPEFYDAQGRFKFSTPNGFEDFQRTDSGTAIISEARNDENLVIAQFHIAIQKFHNQFINQGKSFEEARLLTTRHWQWIIVHEFLPHVAGQDAVDRFLSYNGAGKPKFRGEFYNPGKKKQKPMMPIEFAAAAYRFGHSMVRLAYVLPIGSITKTQVFNATGNDLHGGRPIPSALKIDFANFFDIPGIPVPPGRNISRKIDSLISKSLFALPVPIVVPADLPQVISLPERNLLRGKRLGLPSYQDVAQAMGIVPLTNADLGLTDPGWGGKAPLWFGILKEGEVVEGGRHLGPTGARIITEVILALIDSDGDSYFNVNGQAWKPMGSTGTFTIADLLRAAGAVPPAP